ERLRRLLRQNERRKPHRQQQNQQRTNLHAAVISTHFAIGKLCPPLRVRCGRRFYFATTLTFMLSLRGRGGRESADEGGSVLNLRKSAQSVDTDGIRKEHAALWRGSDAADSGR